MTDDLTILASAYLDGDITAAQRAQVEGDAALVAEVERLRHVRAMLLETDVAAISVRERHLAAALDAWDRIPDSERSGALRDVTPAGADAAAAAGAASFTAPTPLSDRRTRRGSQRMLAMAASLVVVLAGGLVIRAALNNNESVPAFDAAEAPAAADELTARAELETAAADETFDAERAEEIFTEAPAEVSAEAAPADGQSDTFIGADEAPPEDDLEVLESLEDLAIFAADPTAGDRPATEAGQADAGESDSGQPGTAAAPAVDLCDLVTRLVAPAIYRTGLFDDVVWVGVDDARGIVIAYLPETCFEVARTPLER